VSFKRIIPLAFVLIFNLWIWRIFNFNIFIAVIVLASSVFLWLSITTDKKLYFYLSLASFAILIFSQFKTSSINPLTFLNDNEKLQQVERMRGYPPFKISVLGKSFWIPAANWLEKRNETVVYYKILNNFSEIADLNIYFFANHPRERVGTREFEKFPYILLPLFLLGLLNIKKKNIKELLLSLSPMILVSIIGNSNPMGPFSLFPFIATYTSLGVSYISANKKLVIVGLILFILVFIQVIAYAKY
jgi:hypothetical protein